MSYFAVISGCIGDLAPTAGVLVPVSAAQPYVAGLAASIEDADGGPAFLWDDGETATSTGIVSGSEERIANAEAASTTPLGRMLGECAARGLALRIWWADNDPGAHLRVAAVDSLQAACALLERAAGSGADVAFVFRCAPAETPCPGQAPELPPRVAPFWSRFIASTGRDPATPVYEVFHFADTEARATELAALVLQGVKRGTASLSWEYEVGARRAPRPGDLSIVTDWDGAPLCVIETSAVDVCAFDAVGESFAASEGEGGGSLACWREAHWAYFGRVCERLCRERTPGMPVVCEGFRVVYSDAAAPPARGTRA